jgi:hypothetical protein
MGSVGFTSYQSSVALKAMAWPVCPGLSCCDRTICGWDPLALALLKSSCQTITCGGGGVYFWALEPFEP